MLEKCLFLSEIGKLVDRINTLIEAANVHATGVSFVHVLSARRWARTIIHLQCSIHVLCATIGNSNSNTWNGKTQGLSMFGCGSELGDNELPFATVVNGRWRENERRLCDVANHAYFVFFYLFHLLFSSFAIAPMVYDVYSDLCEIYVYESLAYSVFHRPHNSYWPKSSLPFCVHFIFE